MYHLEQRANIYLNLTKLKISIAPMVVLLELSYQVPDKHATLNPLNWALHLHVGNAETSVSNYQQGRSTKVDL